MTSQTPSPDAGTLGPISGPVRTCVGGGRRDGAEALVPLTVIGDRVRVELKKGRASGRGAHVHARPKCLDDAARRGLARSLRRPMRVAPSELVQLTRDAARELAADALERAARGGALEASGGGMQVVPTDAETLSEETRAAVREGRALCLGTRRELGGLLGVAESDLAVVTSGALALRLRRAAAVHTALAGSEVG